MAIQPTGNEARKRLAQAVRNEARMLRDSATDTEGGDQIRDIAELLLVLARAVEGKDVIKAFGAPGDWGYGTPIGDAVLAAIEEAGA